MAKYDDGDNTAQTEVAPPSRSIDPVTGAKSITRTYEVDHASYTPGTYGTDLDPEDSDCVLVNESSSPAGMGIVTVTKSFTSIPANRTEYAPVAFTYPGASSFVRPSGYASGTAYSYDKYGARAPGTRSYNAAVDYSYAMNDGEFAVTDVTVIRYDGGDVDFVGQVYKQTNVNFWDYEGVTVPSAVPTEWILSVEVSRWNGPIWQKKITRVPLT